MAYIKKTQVSGITPAGTHIFYRLSGHWDTQKAVSKIRQAGVAGNVSITHITLDTSGKGRGSVDARFIVDPQGVIQTTTNG